MARTVQSELIRGRGGKTDQGKRKKVREAERERTCVVGDVENVGGSAGDGVVREVGEGMVEVEEEGMMGVEEEEMVEVGRARRMRKETVHFEFGSNHLLFS